MIPWARRRAWRWGRAKSIIGVPPVLQNDGWKSANGSGDKVWFSGFQWSPLAGIGNTRRDAYDTLGSATCVALGPSESYRRRPACVAGLPQLPGVNLRIHVTNRRPRSLLQAPEQ
jgi:hypothetical protein